MSEKQTIGGSAPKPVLIAGDEAVKESVIRTMQKDIDSLRGQSSVKTPQNLPVAKESVIKEAKKAPQTEKKDSLIKRILLRFRKSEETLLKEKERKKDEEQKFIEEKKQKEKRKKIKEEQERIEKERAIEEKKRIVEQKIAEERKKAEKIAEEKTKKEDKKPIARKISVGLPKLIALALVVTIILGGLGGFLYWWNYVRVIIPPVVATYYQCQDFQCVSVEGEGADQCQISQDCQPTEPDIPQSLIPTSETELVVLEAGYEDALIQELELILAKEKEEGALDNILIKIISQTEIRYADLSDFISFLGINLPNEVVQSAATDELVSANYTLFSYYQTEGARLGFVIQIKESVDLSESLKVWETSAQEDLKALFVGLGEEDILFAATEEFQDNIYNEIAIRYLNFPSSDLSIDYAVVDDKLIIATSKESMYAVIDALMPIKYE